MRRLFLALSLALLPVSVSAQVSPYPLSQAPLFGLPAPQGASTNPFTNISFTGQALGPNSCTAYSFTAAPTTGYGYNGTLLCLSVAGSNVFTVSASAVTSTVPYVGPDGSAANPAFRFSAAQGWWNQGSGYTSYAVNSVSKLSIGDDVVALGSAGVIGWRSSTDSFSGSLDTPFTREAAGHSFWRNSTSAQRASWANTYTSATNYSSASADWQTVANTFIFGTRTAATGTGRTMRLYAQASNAGAGGGVIELSPDGGVMVSATAPSGPVACTSPTVTWSNGTAAFQIDVGTACAVSTLVVTLPAVSNAWACSATNVTASATAAVEMTASTTTTATFTNYTRTTGVALNWVDAADVRITCLGG